MPTQWPIAENGLAWLLEQSILTPAQAARLEAQAIADASANTALLQASLEERISRELAASYASGEGRDDWRKRMETIVNTTAWEAENIQRTYTHRAYHEGLKEVLKSPVVGEAFPYFQWSTAGDSRVRPEHVALDGKVAHKDSPLASRMSEEIAAYGCRCQMIPLSREDAVSAGITDNTGWTEPEEREPAEQPPTAKPQTDISTLPPATRPPVPVIVAEPPKPKKPPSLEVSTLPPRVEPALPIQPKSLKDLKTAFPELSITEQKVKIGGKSVVKYVAYDDDGNLVQGDGKDAKSAVAAFAKAIEAPKPDKVIAPKPPTTKKAKPATNLPKADFLPPEKPRNIEYREIEKEMKAVATNTVAAKYEDRERQALLTYAGEGYHDLNKRLREAKDKVNALPAETKQLYQGLKGAIQKAGYLPKETITYRGIGLHDADRDKFIRNVEKAKEKGEALVHDGIVSSSLDPHAAAGFGTTILEIKAKRGLILTALDGKQGMSLPYAELESELLQDHRTRYKIVNIRHNVKGSEYLGNELDLRTYTVIQVEEI